MRNFRSSLPFAIICILTLWFGCKSTEAPVTIIEGDPTAASADTTLQSDLEDEEGEFMQLTVGTLHPIKSMDPLFATNTSTKRFIQQIYEGLVRYNENGEVIPAIASDWQISEDSLTYRFNLRGNVYYHDNDIFAAGTGQRVVARDFRFVFRRMARLNVPPTAAKLFMSIKGFEPYYREHHQLFDPDDRRLDEISGLQTPNDTTLIIELREKDPHLLQKLASPYAVVYPREAIANTPDDVLISEPVGSGPFQFSQRRNDSTYILARFDGYWQNRITSQAVPRLNRVDFHHRSQKDLFEQFTNGSVDLLPEIGPHIVREVVDSTGQLRTAELRDHYRLLHGGNFTYRLLYNKHSNLNRSSIHREIDALNLEKIASAIHPYAMEVSYTRSLQLPDPAPQRTTSLEVPYSDDPFIQQTVSQLKEALKSRDVELQFSDIRVPVQSTGLLTDQQVPLYPHATDSLDAMTLVKFRIQHLGLAGSQVEGINFNPFPWWLNLRETTLTPSKTSI